MKTIFNYSLIGFFTCIMSSVVYAQSGQKFASHGNSLSGNEFLGTINDFPLNIKVNNALALTIKTNTYLQLQSLSGSGKGMVIYDNTGTISGLAWSGNAGQVLLGNGQWGAVPIPENYWKIDQTTNHLYTLTPGNVGIGTQTPVMKLDVNGDAVVRGYLYVNNGVIIGKKIDSKSVYSDTLEVSEKMRANELTSKLMYSDSLDAIKVNVENLAASKEARIGNGLVLDGLYSQIFSNSGLIDFKNTNLTTTGDITANRINATSFHVDTFSVSNVNTSSDIITTGNIYARRIYAEKSVSVGNFTFKNGGTVFGPGKDTIKTENRMAIVSEANSIRMVADTVIMNERVAIGKEIAEYTLDVAGDARFQNRLVVEGGLIIGKEYQGGKGEIDSLLSKEASIDTIRSENVRATEVNAVERINIGSGNTIRIDGLNSQITSTTGRIDFGSNELRTSGPITGGVFNMSTGNFNELSVNSRINIGTNTLILENDPGGQLNSIYTNSGLLKIQSAGYDHHTIINTGNLGKVGIGVDETFFTNNPYAEKVTIAGDLMIKGDGGFDYSDEEATLYLGDNNHYIRSIHGGGLRIGTFQAPDAIMLMQSNGFVGIGTDNPQKSLHVKDIKSLSIPPDQIVALDPIPANPYDDNNYDPTIEAKGSLRLELVAGPGNQAIWDIEPVTSLINTPNPSNKLYIGPTGKPIPVMALNYDGKVGIGTTVPSEQFQIGDRWTFHNGGNKVIGYNYKYSDNEDRRILNDEVAQMRFEGNGDIEFRVAGSGSPGSAIGQNYKVPLVMKNNGFVGIGTTCPDAELCVKGRIKVLDEIVVENTGGWCDFVFDDHYKLSPLSEVEKFIKQNKHLPEIPSAATVEEDGIGLLDMNKKLLKKVEELTLYIIEQEKRIQKLESESNR